jgi:chromosome segregation ATPase
LRSQLSVVTERENRLKAEVGSLQAKIDEMQRSRREVEERLLHTVTENSKLSTELGSLQSSISHKSTEISDLEAQVLRMKTKFSNKIQAISETHQEQAEELSKEIERLRYEKQQLVGFNEGDALIPYGELRAESLRMKSEIQSTFASLQSTQERVQLLEKQLHDEKAEASALRLRLDLQRESNHPPTDMHIISQDNLRRLKEVGSPQFSDDFGPVSLPGSPIEHHNRAALRRERSYSDESPRASSGNMEATLLLAENNRLKNVIRDMRGDLESLQTQLLPGTDASNTYADKKKIEALEERLKQSSDEILKLRSERRRLMDIGNEVRAELNEVKRDFAELRSANEGVTKNVVGAVSRRSENRTINSGAVSFAGDEVDPWLKLPIRKDFSSGQKSSQTSYTEDFASSGEELEVTGNRAGTNSGKISRSVLDKGKGLKYRSMPKPNTAGSLTASTTRKVMNYARAGGDDSES